MGIDESHNKLKKKKSIMKYKDGEPQMKKSKIVQKEEKLAKVTEEKKRKKKRFEVQIRKSKEETDEFHTSYSKDESDIVDGRKKKSKSPKQKKRKNERPAETESVEVDQSNDTEDQLGRENNISNIVGEHERKKSRRKKRKSEKKVGRNVDVDLHAETNDEPEQQRVSITEDNLVEARGHAEEEVYELSSGDEDCTKGMKKWVTDYYQSRPGLEVLQERIDEFITAYETKKEQERKEKEALAAEGGWTVVVHHKGRKKTTESETGVAVGSVSQAAVMDNVAKKKKKDVGLDFYRFQKREAKRNEIMVLQSKFEQDKKRIQQLRAARKFKPY